MKKILAFLSVISVNGFIGLNVVSCTKQAQAKAIDIKSVITKTDLGIIAVANVNSPTKDEINQAIKKINSSYDENYATIKNITNNSATVIGNGKNNNGNIYTGIINISFKTQKATDIKTVITKTNLGEMDLTNQKTPNVSQINEAVLKLNSSYDEKCASVTNITNSTATITSNDEVDNGVIYINSINVTFTVKDTVDIDSIITKTDLGTINLSNTKTVTAEAINNAIVKNNSNYNAADTTISKITTNSATITGNGKDIDGIAYEGTVNVKFIADDNIAISSVITKTDLGEIDIPNNQKTPDANEINEVIKKLNSSYDDKYTTITNITSTTANIESNSKFIDGIQYVGSVTVKFEIVKEIAISSVVTKTDLGTIKLNNEVSPSSDAINKAILNVNKAYDANYTTITDIQNNSATIESNDNAANGIKYTGSVTVKFTINDTIEIGTVITQPDLGNIILANEKQPTANELNGAIKKANENYDSNCATISKISATEATITGNGKSDDGIKYTGTINVSFKVTDNIDIKTVITKTDLGTINFANSHTPDADAVNSAIKAVNENYDSKYAKVTNITGTSATVETNNIPVDGIAYSGSIDVTFDTIDNIDIGSVITKTEIGQIAVDNGTKPTPTQIQNAIQKINPNYNYDHTDVTNISDSSATIVSKTTTEYGTKYNGSIDVTFDTQDDIAISSVIKTTDLGGINLDNTTTITADEINAAINKVNNTYNKANANVTNISSHSATITTNNKNVDGIAYTGSVTVKFDKVDNIAMDNIIKQTSLGNIYLSNGNGITVNQINAAIKHYNSSYNSGYTKVTDITSKSATIVSNNYNINGVIYTESAKVTFNSENIQKTYYSASNYIGPDDSLDIPHTKIYGYDALIDYSSYDNLDDYLNANVDINVKLKFESYVGHAQKWHTVDNDLNTEIKSMTLKKYFGSWIEESHIQWKDSDGKLSYARVYVQLFDDYQDKKILFEFKSDLQNVNKFYDVGNNITISKT